MTPPQYAALFHLIAFLVMACKIALAYVIIVVCFQLNLTARCISVQYRADRIDCFSTKKPTEHDTIDEISSNRANFKENPSMRAVAKIFRARASEHSFNFCEQIEQRPNFASTRIISDHSIPLILIDLLHGPKLAF